MTNKEFEEICLKEFPLIERMVKTVKALGVEYVHCDVYADGTINLNIHETDGKVFHTAWHHSGMEPGETQIVEYDGEGGSEWKPICFYETIPEADPDTTEDDLPFA